VKPVPEIRVRAVNAAPVRGGRSSVLYWMTSARRTSYNPGLQRSVAWCLELKKPLIILEALRCDYAHASDRLHAFVMQGMADNLQECGGSPVRYYPYLEPGKGEGKGLLNALASRACVVVTDEFPGFFLPRMLAAAARDLSVRLEAVDSCGLLPLRRADRAFTTAASFRRFLQKNLHEHLTPAWEKAPLKYLDGLPRPALPREITERWPPATADLLEAAPGVLSRLPLDHRVAVTGTRGGPRAAREALDRFLRGALDRYDTDANHPDRDATSGLSPYLHFGHISAQEVFSRVASRQGWRPGRVPPRATGSRAGWWGMSPPAEAFLDQLITWRELGINMCFLRGEDYDRYESLPAWALQTLEQHARDPRPYVYTPAQFEAAGTHDPLWNAAQTELLREGRVHSYLRMLWGKKILHWSESPRAALHIMLELNDRYALDGRDPNSVSGIFWVLGRYDRPWGPERPVFGKVRYMTSQNTARKVAVRGYLERYGAQGLPTGG